MICIFSNSAEKTRVFLYQSIEPVCNVYTGFMWVIEINFVLVYQYKIVLYISTIVRRTMWRLQQIRTM